MSSFFSGLEATALARFVGESSLLLGLLSGAHLLGLTLLTGSMLVSGLRLTGMLLADEPVREVTAGPLKGAVVGMVISITTGLLLVLPRVSVAAESGFFRLKMVLLCAALAFHFAFYRRAAARRDPETTPTVRRLAGAAGMLLWLGVALAGCAFILLE